MRYLFIMILLGLFVDIIHSRPSQSDENNESQEEAEYEGDSESPADDTLEESRFGDEDSGNQDLDRNQRLLELNRNNYLDKNLAEDQGPQTKSDNPEVKIARSEDVQSDNKFNEEIANANDEFETYSKSRRFIKNGDANSPLEVAQHMSNREVKNFKIGRMHNNPISDGPPNKRTLGPKAQSDEDDMLFENIRDQTSKIDKNDYTSNEHFDLNQRSSYPKQSYNQIEADNRAVLDANSHNNEYLYYNRDRRETMNSNQGDTESFLNVETENENLEKSDNENEEMAIKRHIKKMTGVELEQLLNSLSDEKRSLLKKIIDDVDMSEKTYESVIKREITKKAGAVEDNGYIETGQSESSKIDGPSSAVNIDTTVLPSPQISEPTKQTENQENSATTNQKPSNSENKVDLKGENDNIPAKSDSSLGPNKNLAEVVANQQMTSKHENKRETHIEDTGRSAEDMKVLDNECAKENKDDNNYFSPQNEDFSQFLDDMEQSRSYDNSKIYKRDVESESDLDSKLKSLEESFPNTDAYDESDPYSGPLIRVKRKDPEQIIKKREAAVLPDAKVGYCPYKAESSDDDTDEGNEFDDDGFYDPTPNFVCSGNKNEASNSHQTGKEAVNFKLNTIDQSKSPISDVSGGTMNLGSDTDNVLSNVEGVDENLMFSSGMRNRRKTERNLVEQVDENNLIQSPLDKLNREATSTSSSDIDIPNYQESDSFGGYPRNYEGDLGRYKRIRRVKQSHVSEASLNG